MFVPELIRLDVGALAHRAGLPGFRLIPAAQALRTSLALKLWSIERKRHIIAMMADEVLGLFAGLNASPKKRFFSEYSSRIDHAKTLSLLGGWHAQTSGETLFPGESFNLDFHSVPYHGEHPLVERHYVSMRGRCQPSILAFLAQDAGSHAFCMPTPTFAKARNPKRSLPS